LCVVRFLSGGIGYPLPNHYSHNPWYRKRGQVTLVEEPPLICTVISITKSPWTRTAAR
jgi:hypothetical protein